MIVKVSTILLILGACCALPVEEDESPHVAHALEVSAHFDPTPVKVEALPTKPDNSDLKTDASTWWHSWWHHEYPLYKYEVHSVPHRSYWQPYW